MNEQSSLLLHSVVRVEESYNNSNQSTSYYDGVPRRRCSGLGVWPLLVLSFILGIVATLSVTSRTTTTVYDDPSLLQIKNFELWGKSKAPPALHYFANASTDFAATLPLMKDRDNSFLADLVTSTSKHKAITSGFYRQEAGDPLVYTYTYHEMKIIVAGEFYISDDEGNSVHATPGDVFYFPKGSKITFDSPSFGLGFFCGQRETGKA